jgi:hypothetical protein
MTTPNHDDPRIQSAWVAQYPNTNAKLRTTDGEAAEELREAFADGWIACWLSLRAKLAHHEEASRLCRFLFEHAVISDEITDAEAKVYGELRDWAMADSAKAGR